MKKGMIAAAACLLLTACSAPEPVFVEPATTVRETEETSETAAAETETEAESLESSAGSEAVTEAENTGESAGEEHIRQVLEQIDWGQEKSSLRGIQELMGYREHIRYMGTYNRSEERLDMVLEDGSRLLFLNTTDDTGRPSGCELMMINDRFNDNGFQENYLNQYDVTMDQEYYPETREKLLDQERKWDWNQTDMSIARNEIFARHGRSFSDPFLNAVFRRKTWYKPQYNSEQFARKESSLLNSFEKENLKLLIQWETEKGYRLPAGADYEQPVKLLSCSWLDLDGDGKKEEVKYQRWTYTTRATETYKLTVNNKSVEGSGENIHDNVGIVSLDGGKTVQLLASQDGPSADPMTDVYVYENGEPKPAGTISGDDIQVFKDRIYATAQCDHLQTFQGTLQYEFKDGKVKEVDREFYEQGGEAVALVSIPLLKEKNGAAGITLKAGEKVVIVGGDNREWVLIQSRETGEKGWLRCEKPYRCILPNGTEYESNQLFDGLSFYG